MSPRTAEGKDPGRGVHRHPTNVVRHDLDLTCVDTRSDLDAEFPDRVADDGSAAHGTRRAVEDGQEPIPGLLDLAAAERREVVAHPVIVIGDHLAPSVVAHLFR